MAAELPGLHVPIIRRRLDLPVSDGGDLFERSFVVFRGQVPHRIQLEADLALPFRRPQAGARQRRRLFEKCAPSGQSHPIQVFVSPAK